MDVVGVFQTQSCKAFPNHRANYTVFVIGNVAYTSSL